MSSEVDNGVKLFASLLRAIRNVYEFRKGLYDFVRKLLLDSEMLARCFTIVCTESWGLSGADSH